METSQKLRKNRKRVDNLVWCCFMIWGDDFFLGIINAPKSEVPWFASKGLGSGTSVENLLAVLQRTLHGKQDLTFKAGSTPEDFTLRTLFFFFHKRTCSCGRGGTWLGAGTGFASPGPVPEPREQGWLAASRVRVHIYIHNHAQKGAAVLPLGLCWMWESSWAGTRGAGQVEGQPWPWGGALSVWPALGLADD